MPTTYRLLSDAVQVTLIQQQDGSLRGTIAVGTSMITVVTPDLQLGKDACVLLARMLWDQRMISKQRPDSLENPTWDDSLFSEKKFSGPI